MNTRDYNWNAPRNDRFVLEQRKTARELRQEKCPHLKYSIICATCGKTIGSELTGLPTDGHSHEEIIL